MAFPCKFTPRSRHWNDDHEYYAVSFRRVNSEEIRKQTDYAGGVDFLLTHSVVSVPRKIDVIFLYHFTNT